MWGHEWGRSVQIALLAAGLGCDAEAPDDALAGVGEGSGKEDSASAIELAVGDSVELSVEAKRGDEVDDRHAKALRFNASGSFAVVMRGLDEGFDPFLALYLDDDRIAVSQLDQSVMPMARTSDAIVFGEASESTTFTVVAAENELDADGRFQIDIVPIAATLPELDLSATNPATRAVADALRGYEAAFATGRLGENGDGTLARDESGLDLKSRLDLRREAGEIERVRGELFTFHAEGHAGVVAADIAAVLGSLWAELRRPEHALTR